jgi:hypothetical protein
MDRWRQYVRQKVYNCLPYYKVSHARKHDLWQGSNASNNGSLSWILRLTVLGVYATEIKLYSTRQTMCTHDVTLRRVHESLLPWKNNKYCIFVRVCMRTCAFVRTRACSLDYPACNSYAPYCDVICGLCGTSKFVIISWTARFPKKKKKTLLNLKCVFWFSV